MCQWIRIKEELKKLYETKSITLAYVIIKLTKKNHLSFYVVIRKKSIASGLKNFG